MSLEPQTTRTRRRGSARYGANGTEEPRQTPCLLPPRDHHGAHYAMKSNSIPVRPMTEDAEAWRPFPRLGYPSTTDQTLRRFRAIGVPGAGVWVAETPDGAIVGWIHLFGTGFSSLTRTSRSAGSSCTRRCEAGAWAAPSRRPRRGRVSAGTVVSVRSNVIRRRPTVLQGPRLRADQVPVQVPEEARPGAGAGSGRAPRPG